MIREKIFPGLKFLHHSKFRLCKCCEKHSLFLSLSESDEVKICIRCGANLRYEMLAEYIRKSCPDLEKQTVMELDPRSPLGPLLSHAKKYIRTYYSNFDPLGTSEYNGARCEDITKLTFDNNSIDFIISTEVLEHVSDINAAFKETQRVLRPGGFHLFTIPISFDRITTKRAELQNGKIIHLKKPYYHWDPLDKKGALVFWDFGRDFIELFKQDNLKIEIVEGPRGNNRVLLWKATKINNE